MTFYEFERAGWPGVIGAGLAAIGCWLFADQNWISSIVQFLVVGGAWLIWARTGFKGAPNWMNPK